LVSGVLGSGWLTTGPTVAQFEQEFAAKVGAKFAVAFSSGTSAMIGACAAARLSPKDRLLTSTLSFIASANCGRFFGAAVDLADVNESTLNIAPEEIRNRLKKATKVVVVVHYAGLAADLKPIADVCRERELVLIEDAAHALGGRYRNSTIGDCRYSDMCVFSFHPTKLITTAEGGMVTTNRRQYYHRLVAFRNHGMVRSGRLQPWEYDCRELSFNWRLSDVHSAIGLAQLDRLNEFLTRRREIAGYYNRRFARYPEITIPAEPPERLHAYHLYVIRLRLNKLSADRRAFYDDLREANILAQVHYRPIHLHTVYRRMGYRRGDFPIAERAYKAMLSLPMYPGLSQKQIKYVADTVCRSVERYRRG